MRVRGVCLEAGDAAELAELLEFVREWLGDGPLDNPVPRRGDVQHPCLAIGPRQRDWREPARRVATRLELRPDLGKMIFGVLGEPGHPRAGHLVIAVTGQDVSPRGGEQVRAGHLGQRSAQMRRAGELAHGWLPRMVGGCQVGSGTTTPKPYVVCDPAPAKAANAIRASKSAASASVP